MIDFFIIGAVKAGTTCLHRYLRLAHDVFGMGNLKVMLYDDLLSNPPAFMDEIVGFLGIERFEFDLSEWHNSAPIDKPLPGKGGQSHCLACTNRRFLSSRTCCGATCAIGFESKER